MTLRIKRIGSVAAAALIAGLALSGCSMTPAMNNPPAVNSQNAATDFSGADIMFAQMMIPHHQQAVDMGTLAETRAFSPEVKALAATIKAEQAPEISQMEAWLTASGASSDMGHDMGHGMAMGGMLSEDEFKALENATGPEFDKLFLQGMIAHHEGAIDMAQMIVDSNNTEANALAAAIISSQTEQIEYMQGLLGN